MLRKKVRPILNTTKLITFAKLISLTHRNKALAEERSILDTATVMTTNVDLFSDENLISN